MMLAVCLDCGAYADPAHDRCSRCQAAHERIVTLALWVALFSARGWHVEIGAER